MKTYIVVSGVGIPMGKTFAVLPADVDLFAIVAADSWPEARSRAAEAVHQPGEFTLFEVADSTEQNIAVDRTPVITWTTRDTATQQWRSED